MTHEPNHCGLYSMEWCVSQTTVRKTWLNVSNLPMAAKNNTVKFRAEFIFEFFLISTQDKCLSLSPSPDNCLVLILDSVVLSIYQWWLTSACSWTPKMHMDPTLCMCTYSPHVPHPCTCDTPRMQPTSCTCTAEIQRPAGQQEVRAHARQSWTGATARMPPESHRLAITAIY